MTADIPGPSQPTDLVAALTAAREEALRYRRAYELVSAAFSQNAGELYGERQRRQALDHARLVRIYGSSDLVCYDYWLDAGAVLAHEAYGAVVKTPAEAWHYAAGVPLDLSGVDFFDRGLLGSGAAGRDRRPGGHRPL